MTNIDTERYTDFTLTFKNVYLNSQLPFKLDFHEASFYHRGKVSKNVILRDINVDDEVELSYIVLDYLNRYDDNEFIIFKTLFVKEENIIVLKFSRI